MGVVGGMGEKDAGVDGGTGVDVGVEIEDR